MINILKAVPSNANDFVWKLIAIQVYELLLITSGKSWSEKLKSCLSGILLEMTYKRSLFDTALQNDQFTGLRAFVENMDILLTWN